MNATIVLPPVDEMERAYLASDPDYDGIFLVAVRTTGIFCRPSCPARKPKPENVEYFGTAGEALSAGFRACRRCRPLDTDGGNPHWVDRLLRHIDESPDTRVTDVDLRNMGLEPARVRRFFRDHFGMTFQSFCRARRLGDAFMRMKEGKSIDESAINAGFDSVSGFRDAFTRHFGKPPGTSRNGDFLSIAWQPTPLGPMIAAASTEGICMLEFTNPNELESQLQALQRQFNSAIVPSKNPHIEQLQEEIAEYFGGTRQTFHVPLVYPGSPFQVRVWDALQTIPYGDTWSYEQLASVVGNPDASRAVGRANGTNRIVIVIPCHRVVNKNGQIGGYGGGVWRKRYLLELEKKAKW